MGVAFVIWNYRQLPEEVWKCIEPLYSELRRRLVKFAGEYALMVDEGQDMSKVEVLGTWNQFIVPSLKLKVSDILGRQNSFRLPGIGAGLIVEYYQLKRNTSVQCGVQLELLLNYEEDKLRGDEEEYTASILFPVMCICDQVYSSYLRRVNSYLTQMGKYYGEDKRNFINNFRSAFPSIRSIENVWGVSFLAGPLAYNGVGHMDLKIDSVKDFDLSGLHRYLVKHCYVDFEFKEVVGEYRDYYDIGYRGASERVRYLFSDCDQIERKLFVLSKIVCDLVSAGNIDEGTGALFDTEEGKVSISVLGEVECVLRLQQCVMDEYEDEEVFVGRVSQWIEMSIKRAGFEVTGMELLASPSLEEFEGMVKFSF